MRFSEVFLRLGCALVAWMMLYAHFVWLAALGNIGCGPDGDELHKVLLALAPLTIGCAFVLRVTRPLGEIHSILRWLGVPLAAIMLAGTYHALVTSGFVYSTGQGFCSPDTAETWQQLWGPAQLLAIIVTAVMIIRVWRNASEAAASD
jgi:hypothetical protein